MSPEQTLPEPFLKMPLMVMIHRRLSKQLPLVSPFWLFPILFLLMTVAANESFGEVKVDRLFPPAARIGDETMITAEGKFDPWPVQVWCDRTDVVVTAEKESGKWKVGVSADALPGIAWLRFYDGKSASTLQPLVIEPAAVFAETEPNNSLDKATRLDLPAVAVGKLDKGGEVDCFVFSATVGETLVATVMANRVLNSPMDAVLQLVDARGNVLAQNDDARGIDPQIVFSVPADGDYILRLFAFPLVPNSTIGFAGGTDFVYRMEVTVGPKLDYALPLVEPGDGLADDFRPNLVGWKLGDDPTSKTALPTGASPSTIVATNAIGWSLRPRLLHFSNPALVDLTTAPQASPDRDLSVADWIDAPPLPVLVSGKIDRPGQVIKVRVPVDRGIKNRATIYSQSSGLKLDSVITVTEPESDKQLARNDDLSGSNRDASVDFTLDAKSQQTSVEIQITDLVGGFGNSQGFTLAIHPVKPSVSLTVDAGEHKVVAGQSLEIPVKIARADGFDQAISIAAIDLPEGVMATAIVSEPKGDTSKEVKLKLEATALDNETIRGGNIRIVATPVVEGENEASSPTAVATFEPKPGFQSNLVWLTVDDAKPSK